MQDLKTFLTQEKPGTLMRHYSLPCIISLLVAALYNIVDQIFIANASYLGSYGNSANTVVYPLTVAALSVAVLIGDGVCAFSSIASGAGRTDDTHHAVGNGIVMCIVSSLVITALYLVFADQIITLFGAANEAEIYTEFAIKSFRVYLMLMPLATVNKGTFISLQALG
ncbi:MATE family efflux transporter, partial [Galactobacillus timonensis]|uniref:MATE family efflux transporter n=1 Tax=Galactobacillus timonensis TaxID=2041840 RepID=UPI002409F5B3